MDPRPVILCLHCAGNRFWIVPAKSRHTLPNADKFDLLLGRAGELLKDSWVDAWVCKGCGAVQMRVADLERFARAAAAPDSGIVDEESPSLGGPYR